MTPSEYWLCAGDSGIPHTSYSHASSSFNSDRQETQKKRPYLFKGIESRDEYFFAGPSMKLLIVKSFQ